MKSLLLDRATWDLTVDAYGNIAVADEPYRIAQDVACALRLFQGELWYDTTKGIPYWEEVLGKQPPISFIKSKFEAAALTVPGVARAKCFIASISGRVVSGQVQVTDKTGTTQLVGF